MDRRPRLGPFASLLASATALAACAGQASTTRVLARGVLPYGVATTGDAVVTVELAERFELVVRALAPGGPAERRLDLGPPEHDLRALAVTDRTAFVGSDAGFIHEIDLASMRPVQSYAVGAPLRALAADASYLLSADTSGAVCLRRRGDGALLQCAHVAEPVGRLELDGETVRLIAEPRPAQAPETPPQPAALIATWSVPALHPPPSPQLASTPPESTAVAEPFQGGAVTSVGHQVIWQRGGERRVLAVLATDVRFMTVTASGSLIVAAWPTSLDDAVLLLIQ
jgi:hypothetical protein